MNEWYKNSAEKAIAGLKSDIEGLSHADAAKRLKKYGRNRLPKQKKHGPVKIFFSEFKDPIIAILLFAAAFSFVANEIVDSIVILFIILADAVIGTVQEWKAGQSAEALQNLIRVKVKVLRNDTEIEIDSEELVKGDIVLIEPGNKISADMRIIDSQNLTIDESILTGESINAIKSSHAIHNETTLADRKNMLYAGTSAITGRATGIVVETGICTEIGKIAEKVTNTKETPSPLTIRMGKLSKQIAILIIIVAVIVTILLISKGEDVTTIFLSVIALSVSAMPEGLPLAFTMALTIGSSRMAKKNVIVKKLNAVESLGSCTVIASDKTGTLTVNEQTAKKIVLPDNTYFDIEGTGYNNSGKVISANNAKLEHAEYISKLGALNNEANLMFDGGKWTHFGDSIDVAFLALDKKMGTNDVDFKIRGEIPYESENKYSAVFYERDDKIFCTIKGSLEKIFELSANMKMDGADVPIDIEAINKQNEDLASDGFRVIAMADGEIKDFKEKDIYTDKDIKDLTFIGLVAFIDPIRKEAAHAIKECKTAGIKVVMITGDHPLTALAIAKQLDIAGDPTDVATGNEVKSPPAKAGGFL